MARVILKEGVTVNSFAEIDVRLVTNINSKEESDIV